MRTNGSIYCIDYGQQPNRFMTPALIFFYIIKCHIIWSSMQESEVVWLVMMLFSSTLLCSSDDFQYAQLRELGCDQLCPALVSGRVDRAGVHDATHTHFPPSSLLVHRKAHCSTRLLPATTWGGLLLPCSTQRRTVGPQCGLGSVCHIFADPHHPVNLKQLHRIQQGFVTDAMELRFLRFLERRRCNVLTRFIHETKWAVVMNIAVLEEGFWHATELLEETPESRPRDFRSGASQPFDDSAGVFHSWLSHLTFDP